MAGETLFSLMRGSLQKHFGVSDKTAWLSVLVPGLTVDSSVDVYTPSGLENFFLLCDCIPKIEPAYTISGMRLSGEFSKILNAELPPPAPITEQELKRIDDAMEYINRNFRLYNSVKMEMDTLLADYNRLRAANPVQAGVYQSRYKELRRMHNDILSSYEKQRDVVFTLARSHGPAAYFRHTKELYEQLRYNGSLPETRCLPEQWASEPNSLTWTEVSIDGAFSGEGTKETASRLPIPSDTAERLEEIAGRKDSRYTVCFQTARVMLLRDWLDFGLLTFKNLSIPGCERYSISNGSLAGAEHCTMPVYPSNLILTRNLRIYWESSEESRKKIETLVSQNQTALSFGPFRLSGGVGVKRVTEQEERKYNAQFLVSAPGIQISAILSAVTPAFPHIS